MTLTPRIRGTCGELTGSKARSNIILHFRILLYVEKFARQSDLSPNRKQGGGRGVQPNKLASNRTGVINETVTYVVLGGNMHKKIPLVLHWRHITKHLFFFLWTLHRMWLNRSHEKSRGVQALEVWTRKLYMGGFYN